MEITGFFVATLSTSALGIAVWLFFSRFFKKKKIEGKSLESEILKISRELDELYRSLNEEAYKNLNLIFLEKTKELLDGQKKFHNNFLFTELKDASFYLEQFLKSIRIKNKNPYLLYKAKHFLIKGMESIPDLYLKNEMEKTLLAIENLEKMIS
ncbi:MAG: hypothetical protein QXQ77_00185 [Candidatus Aenigmatarchaeota archaeon]